MKLVIGLGNPGKEYENTRHNVGFMVIDVIKNSKIPKLQDSKQFKIFKSNKFMNESGEFVKKLLLKYPSIPVSSIYIVHDDLDIKLGEYKIQFGHGPKDHNGVKSVDTELGTNQYWHVRVGVDNRPERMGLPTFAKATAGEKYVLQNFTEEEKVILNETIKKAIPAILSSR